jgi:hypothetical protein
MLLLANLTFDQNFNDAASTILSYDGITGAPAGALVGVGQGLDIPFFLTVATPEPGTTALLLLGIAGMMLLRRAPLFIR